MQLHQITLAAVIAIFLPVEALAQGSSPTPEPSATNRQTSGSTSVPVLSDGIYENFTFGDRIQLTAAMIANPERLKTVSFGTVFNASQVELSDDVITELYLAGTSGEIAFATKQSNGTYAVLPMSDQGVVPWASAGQNCELADDLKNSEGQLEICRKILENWIVNNGKTNAVILAADPSVVSGTPLGKVINWSKTKQIQE